MLLYPLAARETAASRRVQRPPAAPSDSAGNRLLVMVPLLLVGLLVSLRLPFLAPLLLPLLALVAVEMVPLLPLRLAPAACPAGGGGSSDRVPAKMPPPLVPVDPYHQRQDTGPGSSACIWHGTVLAFPTLVSEKAGPLQWVALDALKHQGDATH